MSRQQLHKFTIFVLKNVDILKCHDYFLIKLRLIKLSQLLKSNPIKVRVYLSDRHTIRMMKIKIIKQVALEIDNWVQYLLLLLEMQ